MIDPEKVGEAYDRSLKMDGEALEHTITVHGIGQHSFFKPRLEEHREQVREWLSQLPLQFRAERGGGWSFLNACHTQDEEQWTGLHARMEQLFGLGLGLGLVKCSLPREMWSILPGGMPYYSIYLGESPKETNNPCSSQS